MGTLSSITTALADLETNPEAEAVIVALTLPLIWSSSMTVTGNVTDVCPAGMVTVAGTVNLLVSALSRETVSGLVVEVLRVTVPTAAGLGRFHRVYRCQDEVSVGTLVSVTVRVALPEDLAGGTGRQRRRLRPDDDAVIDRADREGDRRGSGRDCDGRRHGDLGGVRVRDRHHESDCVVAELRVTVAVVASLPAASLTRLAREGERQGARDAGGRAATAVLLAVFTSKTSPNGFSMTSNQYVPAGRSGTVTVADRETDCPAVSVPLYDWARTRVGLSPAASVARRTCSVQGPRQRGHRCW